MTTSTTLASKPASPTLASAELSNSSRDLVSILLVDDEVRNLDALESVLDNPEYRLVRAQNAEQALLSLIQSDFAVIVLDVRMPNMSGLQLAQVIKQRKKTQHIPIIFLTAYYQEDEHMIQGYGAGAVDYLNKPFNPVILRSKVAVFVDLYRKTRALESEISGRKRLEAEIACVAERRAWSTDGGDWLYDQRPTDQTGKSVTLGHKGSGETSRFDHPKRGKGPDAGEGVLPS
jgi:DNA-binding response OmpR family regulator